MSQLIKHYFINRDTGEWVIHNIHGYMVPNLKGLDIQHWLYTDNQVPYALSTVPDYFEYAVTVSAEKLQELENSSGITIVSSIEIPALEPTEENPNLLSSYEVVYRKDNALEVSDGLQILTQEQWDEEIAIFDARQMKKRFNVLREIRDELLKLTDWVVIKAKEQETNLTEKFKTWRQELRDLPGQETFPSSFLPLPSFLENDKKLQEVNSRFGEIRSIRMINDPLPPLPMDDRRIEEN
jgi:hypothetical protein